LNPPAAAAPAARATPARQERNITMDMSKYSGAAFLKVGDIKANGPVRVMIADVQIGEYGKPDLWFTDGTRLSVNATNNKILCQAYGIESDNWMGKELELVVGELEFKGKPQEAVLIKPISAPIEKKPPPKRKNRGSDMNDEIDF
jgi:hypothetical protein